MRLVLFPPNRRPVRRVALMLLAIAICCAISSVGVLAAQPRILIVGWDGVPGGHALEYAAEGNMPTLSWLLREGSFAPRGILPVVPANTGPTWPSVLTGSFPGRHGVTNNSFHDIRKAITAGEWARPDVVLCETLPQVAQRYGLRVAVLGGAWTNWPPEDAGLSGPVIGWGNWHSKPIVISNYKIEGAELAPYLWMDYQLVKLHPQATLPGNLRSFSPPQSFRLDQTTYSGDVFTWDLVTVDSTNDNQVNYDRLAVVRTGESSESHTVVTTLAEGEWRPIRVTVEGNLAGFYIKLLDLTKDLSKIRIYVTAIRSVQAFPDWLQVELSQYTPIPISPTRDPLIGGFVDEQTFFEEVLMSINWDREAYKYVIQRTEPDIVFAWFGETDEIFHRLWGHIDPNSPFFVPELTSSRNRMFRDTYEAVDNATWSLWESTGGPERATLILLADHGFSSTWKIANVNERLSQGGLFDKTSREKSQAIAYSAGAATQVYINLEGREPGGVVPQEDYTKVQKQIIDLLNSWVDTDGSRVMARVLTKDQAAAIEIGGRTFSMHNEHTTGDVVAFAAPPYQLDAATPGVLIAPAIPYFSGQHGYLADAIPEEFGSMRPLFAAGGPGILKGSTPPLSACVIDIAPTVAALLHIEAPRESDGKVLSEIMTHEHD